MEVKHPDHHYLIAQTHLWLIIAVAMISTGVIAVAALSFPNANLGYYGLSTGKVLPLTNSYQFDAVAAQSARKLQTLYNQTRSVTPSKTNLRDKLGHNVSNQIIPESTTTKFSLRIKTL